METQKVGPKVFFSVLRSAKTIKEFLIESLSIKIFSCKVIAIIRRLSSFFIYHNKSVEKHSNPVSENNSGLYALSKSSLDLKICIKSGFFFCLL